jgi:hypothetical protein
VNGKRRILMSKEFESKVTLVFEGNSIEADSKEEYLEKLKELFYDEFNIELRDSEITEIVEVV